MLCKVVSLSVDAIDMAMTINDVSNKPLYVHVCVCVSLVRDWLAGSVLGIVGSKKSEPDV